MVITIPFLICNILHTMITFKKKKDPDAKPKKKKKTVRRRRKKKKLRKKYTQQDRAEYINEIFESGEMDLKYVTDNDELYKKHEAFINRCMIERHFYFSRFKVPDGPNKGNRPRSFVGFEENYYLIYRRWLFLIKCCLKPNFYLYKYFGGKGIYISNAFLNGKKFCLWCLKNGLTSGLSDYIAYLQRKDKTKWYSPCNCYVLTEKANHERKSLSIALDNLFLCKKYEEYHDPSVSYMTAYNRYYGYDFQAEDAVSYKYDTSSKKSCFMTLGFSPTKFYRSVATESDCSKSTFLSRYHYSYLNGGFIARPYDMLKPDYSVSSSAEQQGKVSYKRQYDKNKKKEKAAAYNYEESFATYLTNDFFSVYSNSPESSVYKNIGE